MGGTKMCLMLGLAVFALAGGVFSSTLTVDSFATEQPTLIIAPTSTETEYFVEQGTDGVGLIGGCRRASLSFLLDSTSNAPIVTAGISGHEAAMALGVVSVPYTSAFQLIWDGSATVGNTSMINTAGMGPFDLRGGVLLLSGEVYDIVTDWTPHAEAEVRLFSPGYGQSDYCSTGISLSSAYYSFNESLPLGDAVYQGKGCDLSKVGAISLLLTTSDPSGADISIDPLYVDGMPDLVYDTSCVVSLYRGGHECLYVEQGECMTCTVNGVDTYHKMECLVPDEKGDPSCYCTHTLYPDSACSEQGLSSPVPIGECSYLTDIFDEGSVCYPSAARYRISAVLPDSNGQPICKEVEVADVDCLNCNGNFYTASSGRGTRGPLFITQALDAAPGECEGATSVYTVPDRKTCEELRQNGLKNCTFNYLAVSG